ncbi:TP53-binding protein 1 [Plecturocebus cupreus]
MGPAEPVQSVYSAPRSAAPAKRVMLATRVAPLPGISRSVDNKNSSENTDSSQLGFGVLELSQSQDIEENTVPCEVDKEHLQSVTTNSGYTRLSDVDANTAIKHKEQSSEDIPVAEQSSKDVPVIAQPSKDVCVVKEQNLPPTRSKDMPISSKVSLAAVETKEQISAQELMECGLQIQKSPEPEVLSTQEDLFDQSNKTESCSVTLPSSSSSPASISQRWGFTKLARPGLELLTSCDPPASASQSAGITAVPQSKKGDKPFGRPRWADHLMSGVRDQPGHHGETTSLLKIRKISWAWWWVPVIPAMQEAEVGESLGPWRWRLQDGISLCCQGCSLTLELKQSSYLSFPEFESSLASTVKAIIYQKIHKSAGHGGTHLWYYLLRRLRQEKRLNPGGEGYSELRSFHCTALQPGQQSETLSQKKNKEFKDEL